LVFYFPLYSGEEGIGLKGIWIALVIGMSYQIFAQIYIINSCDWQQVANEALDRINSQSFLEEDT
jgi:Na+-driven multidrug efflux pump